MKQRERSHNTPANRRAVLRTFHGTPRTSQQALDEDGPDSGSDSISVGVDSSAPSPFWRHRRLRAARSDVWWTAGAGFHRRLFRFERAPLPTVSRCSLNAQWSGQTP